MTTSSTTIVAIMTILQALLVSVNEEQVMSSSLSPMTGTNLSSKNERLIGKNT